MRLDPYQYEGNAETIYTDCADDTLYVGTNFPFVGTYQEVYLGSSAASDLENQLVEDWFAIGLVCSDEVPPGGLYAINGGASANPTPTLEVSYII